MSPERYRTWRLCTSVMNPHPRKAMRTATRPHHTGPTREFGPPESRHTGVGASPSEEHADAAVDDTAVERRPGVHRPAAVGMTRRAHQRVEARLTHAAEVLRVREHADRAEALLHQRANDPLALALVPIGVLVERLAADVIHLEPGPSHTRVLRHQIERGVVSR